ncbi:hypothetical protein L6164_011673 [Bauhinia variegata]|uniref:Uncharacterized protein n=1 Tax=Bauhinia variegata TaxID=167791 RepID=A0ACB9P6P4_BAUVA|nr:hypothetical protein L6164_011673 [Bauhinia variegata]
MGTSKLFMFIFASLIIVIAPYHQEPEDAISRLRFEFVQLKYKVSVLETNIEKTNRKLKSKDESIEQMEKIILEKEESISSLQNNIDSLQQEEPLDAKRQMNEPHAHVVELEKQVDKIKRDIEMLDKKKVELQVRANVADKKIQELHFKLVNEEMVKSKLEVTFMELVEDYQGWLPYWLVIRLRDFQSFIVARWNYCWRPALEESFQKILVKLSHIQTDAVTCIETIKIEWIPVMKDQWLAFISYVKPYVESQKVKTIEVYHACMNSQTVKEAHKFAESYMYQLKTVSKPYLDKALTSLQPYSKNAVYTCRKIVLCVVSCHEQIQQLLKTNELTRSLVTMDLAWFAATLLLLLPLVFICRLRSAIFRKKARKSRHDCHTHQARRRRKWPYPDYQMP